MFTDWTAFLNDRDQLPPTLCLQILFIWHHSIRDVLLITNRDRFKRTSLSLSPRGPLVAGDLISPHPHPHSDFLACLLSGHKLRNSTILHHGPLKAVLWQQTRQRKTDLSMRSVNPSKSLPRLPIATKTSSRQKCSYPHTSSLPHHHLVDCTEASNQHWNLIDLAILCSYIKRNKPLIPEIQNKNKAAMPPPMGTMVVWMNQPGPQKCWCQNPLSVNHLSSCLGVGVGSFHPWLIPVLGFLCPSTSLKTLCSHLLHLHGLGAGSSIYQ